ncbi:MAG: DUF6531 domain-containing protein [Alphaproteobacteria bacterium]|nr:DUF6531 domain-containing protein [Alphaproteobacteria bacterium]
MLKRALVGFLFGLTVFASGLDFGGPRAAHALHGSGGYWDGMETGCPSAGEYGLAGHCPSAAAACQSFENSSGWEWVQTKPDYDGEGRLIAYYCVLERHSPIGVLYPEYRTHPHCPTGWVDASTESGCLGNYGIPRAQGDPCSKVGSLGTTGVVGAGNPINLVGYSKYEHAVDFATAGPEVLSFERSYNSRDHNVYRTMTGHGWKTSFDGRLAFEPSWDSVSKVHLTRPTGQMITFTKSGSSFIPPPDIKNVTLTHDSATLYYTLKHGNNDAELYNRHGYLLRITRPSGYQISFEYTFFEDVGHSRKIRAYDSLGREIFFTYSNRKLATVTATDGRVYKYIYGDGVFGANDLLTEVVYPDDTPATDADNPRVIYHYEDTRFPYSLTGITNEAGDRYATFTYSPNNLPLSTEHAGGADLTEVRYVTSETRSVTNPLGKKANYNFALIQGMRRLTSIDGEASANCPAASRFVTYDADAQVTSRTDWEGNTTAYVNNSRGLPTSITEAQGTPEARTTTITWHPSLTLPTQVTEPGRRTDYTYTAGGQVLTRTVTDLTTHTVPYATNGRTRVWTYTYDAAGLLASVDGPRTDVSDVTTYAYTVNGYLATVTNALGHVTTVTAHDGMGRPLSITDANNVVTDLAYDPRGRLLSVTVNGVGGNAVTAMAYSAAGDVLRVTRPDGSYLDFVYDAARRLTAIQDNLG